MGACASVSVTDSYVFDGVPPEKIKEFCLAVEDRMEYYGDHFLLKVYDVRGPTRPPSAGTCWSETHRSVGGHILEVRKRITDVKEISKKIPLELKLSVEVAEAPIFVPKFHGTHTTQLIRQENGDTLMERSHAFVPESFGSKVFAILCRRWLRKQFRIAAFVELELCHEAALKQMAGVKKSEAVMEQRPVFASAEMTAETNSQTTNE